MNPFGEMPVQDEVSALLLTPSVVRAARDKARQTQQSVPAVLETDLSLSPERLLLALGHALHLRPLTSQTLSGWTPAFDVIGYADAAKRGCLAFRDGGAMIVVVSDPFDDGLQAWCVERVAVEHELCLAQAADIAAFLSRHEDSMRAIDTAMPAGDHEGIKRYARGCGSLGFTSI